MRAPTRRRRDLNALALPDDTQDAWGRAGAPRPPGRQVVVTIGIDRYLRWGRLQNAVNDANGALAAFTALGFEPLASLLNQDATGRALQRLVTDDLSRLTEHDSLVVFFAGHGHSDETKVQPHGSCIQTGYLMPVDAEPVDGHKSSWLHLEHWLDDIDRLPALHILVILDACHSGIAAHPQALYRGQVRNHDPYATLRKWSSRRLLTSAFPDQQAWDSGPVPGHSLFTGCLLEALHGGLGDGKAGETTGSELSIEVQRRVIHHSGSEQTPAIGALKRNQGGELILRLNGSRAPIGGSVGGSARPGGLEAPRPIERSAPVPGPGRTDDGTRPPPPRPIIKPAPRSPLHRALDHQQAERAHGGSVLSVLAGDQAAALPSWARWAAHGARLTLVTTATTIDAARAELLAQLPWLRAVPDARRRLAGGARLEVREVDAALGARAGHELTRWLRNAAGDDDVSRVGGWLLAQLREPLEGPPAFATAPAPPHTLLARACQLGPPLAFAFHHATPTACWLAGALTAAAALVAELPGLPVAVIAPSALLDEALAARRGSNALSMARQGRVSASPTPRRGAAIVRGALAQALHAALEGDARTAGQFQLGVELPIHERRRTVEVELMARGGGLAIELDRWHHLRDPRAYHRDRIKDAWLQCAGFFVLRLLVEDVEQRLAQSVDEIADCLAACRAFRPLFGDPR